MQLSTKANRGRGLEIAIIASQGTILTLDKMGTQVRYLRGGKTQAVKSPPDFIGTVTGSGRAVCFDAKECQEVRGFPIRQWAKARPLQREWILRHGEAGAVAGLLVEAKALREFRWLDWRTIVSLERHRDDGGRPIVTVPWDAPWEWNDLGDTFHAIRFIRIPGVGGA